MADMFGLRQQRMASCPRSRAEGASGLPPATICLRQATAYVLRGCPHCGGDLERDRDTPSRGQRSYTCLLCGRSVVGDTTQLARAAEPGYPQPV